MSARDFDNIIGTGVKPTDRTKHTLSSIQRKIQNLNSDSGNSGFLQQLLYEAGQLIGLTDKEAGEKIQEYSDDLNFYLVGGQDNLEKFYHCKGESPAIITKQVSG